MDKITVKEFAEKIEKGHDWVLTYAKRGKLKIENGLIDLDLLQNKHFLEKWTIKKSNSPEPVKIPSGNDSDNPYLMDLEIKALEFRKKSADAQLAEEKLKKIRGEVVPSVLIKPVFERYSRSCVTSFKNAVENVLQEMMKRYGLSREDLATDKKRILEITNEAIEEAYQTAVMETKLIINEYSEKRGIGEKV